MDDYDYYVCGICDKKKPVGGEVVRRVAFNKYNAAAQGNEARLRVYCVLVCPQCDTENEG